MGLLLNEDVLSFEEILENKDCIKKRAAEQFIQIYKQKKNIQSPYEMEVGYEMELFICKKEDGETKLNLIAEDVQLKDLNLQLEFARYMIEFVPANPFNIKNIKNLPIEMQKHFGEIESHLQKFDSYPLLCTNFFRLGEQNIYAKNNLHNPKLNLDSEFFPTKAITPHNRFYSFAQSIKNYRGKKINYAIDDSVFIDSMGQGMGCNSLHITISLQSLNDARKIYDAFLFFAPLFLHLSSATPIVQSQLVSSNTRWNFLAASVDCKMEEYGRFSPPFFFLATNKFNDFHAKINKSIMQFMQENGVDENISMMLGNEFYFDPILSYAKKDNTDFENLHSSNWRSVRLKLPTSQSKDKWLVEFRPLELQMSLFENGAYVIFMFYLARVILKYDLKFYIPISKTLENYNQKTHFYVKNNFLLTDGDFSKKTLKEIFNEKIEKLGKSVIELIYAENLNGAEKSINFIVMRINNELVSNAEYIRNYCGDIKGKINNRFLEKLIGDMRSSILKSDGEYLRKKN